MKYLECGCCGHFHKEEFTGDCRDDSARFTQQEIEEDIDGGTPNIEMITLEDIENQ